MLGYKSITVGGLVIKRGRARIPLNGLTPPHCAAIPKPRPGLSSCYVVAFHFVYSDELDEGRLFVINTVIVTAGNFEP